MSVETFLDTNILVYAFDRTSPVKAQRARELIQGYHWQISWQVVQEFASVALHRFVVPLSAPDLASYLDLVLWPRCKVLPTASLYRRALELQQQTQYRFYDSLVIASALAAEVKILYSEDLQSGRSIGDLTIVNPFTVRE